MPKLLKSSENKKRQTTSFFQLRIAVKGIKGIIFFQP